MMTLAKGEPDAFLVKSYQIKSSQIMGNVKGHKGETKREDQLLPMAADSRSYRER